MEEKKISMLKACQILEINKNDISSENVRKQYRIKALYYHPDKNNSPDAKERFQEVVESYEFLCNRIENKAIDKNDNPNDYTHFVTQFFKNIIQGVNQEELLYSVLKKTTFLCEEKALESLEGLEKNTLIKLYEIYQKNKECLHLKEEFIERIKEFINQKIEQDECVILKPNIDDLLNDNVYKLKVQDHTFMVPLWHNELVYDNSGNDTYVKCSPALDDNIEIDSKNNIYVYIRSTIDKIWKDDEVTISVGSRKYFIKREELSMKTNQQYIFKGRGMSKINYNDMYDVTRRGDIIIHLKID